MMSRCRAYSSRKLCASRVPHVHAQRVSPHLRACRGRARLPQHFGLVGVTLPPGHLLQHVLQSGELALIHLQSHGRVVVVARLTVDLVAVATPARVGRPEGATDA